MQAANELIHDLYENSEWKLTLMSGALQRVSQMQDGPVLIELMMSLSVGVETADFLCTVSHWILSLALFTSSELMAKEELVALGFKD